MASERSGLGLNVEYVLTALENAFPATFSLMKEGPGGFELLAKERLFFFHSLPRSAGEERLLLRKTAGPADLAETVLPEGTGRLPEVHIWEDQWERRRPAVLSRMAALLGFCTRVHGRETLVRRVDASGAYRFLEAHHLLVPLKGKYRYGLYFRDELVSLAVFSGGRQMRSRGEGHRSFELLRFCHASGKLVTGGLSKLLAAFTADFQPGDIMTYVDLDWSGGESFLKNGFEPAGMTPPQLFWIHPGEGHRYYPQRLPVALQTATPARMHQSGYFRIYNSGSLKLIRYDH